MVSCICFKKDGNGSGHLYGTDSAGMDEKNFSGVTAGLFYRYGRIRGIYLFGRDTKGADCRGVVSPDSDSGIADGRICRVWRD